MITRNVASKHYCLLQVLVAALLLVSCAAFANGYREPLNCRKYYLRKDNNFYLLTCPKDLVFDQYIEQCNQSGCKFPDITRLNGNDYNQNMPGYYCESMIIFTYCTQDGLKIIDTALCPVGPPCIG